jgi:hypothetical protein
MRTQLGSDTDGLPSSWQHLTLINSSVCYHTSFIGSYESLCMYS